MNQENSKQKRTIIKHIISTIALVPFLAAILFNPSTSRADDLWSEDYYRASDSTHEISDYMQKDLDETCIDAMKQYGVDLVLLVVKEEDYADSTIEECAWEYYEDCNFGYGEDRSGFISIYDADNDKEYILTRGKAEGMIPENYLSFAEKSIPALRENHGIYGVMYGAATYITDYLEENPEGSGKTTKEIGDAKSDNADGVLPLTPDTTDTDKGTDSADAASLEADTGSESTGSNAQTAYDRSGEGANLPLPSWYPKDPNSFQFFHTDDSTPRVVDNAHIFTDSEQKEMEDRLSDIRSEINKDIVIFTDESTYGFDREVYAADFFDYNGYGCGEDYEGICLLICMDPNDRGWWAACYGPETKRLYTEEYANEIDDALYDYMVAGDYGGGVDDWITNIYTLYTRGAPFAPDWLPEDENSFTRFHDPDAMRIADAAHVLGDEYKKELDQMASDVAEKYGIDVIITTARESFLSGMTPDEYAEAFYRYNGYGLGENYDGILLTLVIPRYGSNTIVMYSEGAGDTNLTEVNEKRLLGFCEDDLGSKYEDSRYFQGMSKWIKNVDHMYKTGRVPRSALYWGWISFVGILAGLITGGTTLGKARKKMEAPKLKYGADMYMVKDSLNIRGSDRFVNKTTSRQYSPVKTEDSSSTRSSSSSSRSSYSSSYSSSSGRSHSGSGRSF